MQQAIILHLVFTLVLALPVQAQQYDRLTELKDHSVQIYHSPGHEKRAAAIALRIDRAMAYYQQMLDFKPGVTLLVLDMDDWSQYSAPGAVYGMPHYTDDKKLIVAAEDNAFWKGFLPPLEQLPVDLREQIATVYRGADSSSLSMQAFFDLLAIHELGHAFQFQGGLTLQRKWMGELFANILLHTYIAGNEPGQLPALTLFPRMGVAGGAKEFTFTHLTDIEERYNEIGRKYPKNYGWYQCRWHVAAARIYDAGGKAVCRKLWDALKEQKEILTDEELVTFLAVSADKSVADVMRNWDCDTVK